MTAAVSGSTSTGERRQAGDLQQMIWKVPEVISRLSTLFVLQPGDLIYTGTPAGVGPVVRGDLIRAHIEGIGELTNQCRLKCHCDVRSLAGELSRAAFNKGSESLFDILGCQ